MTRAWSATRVLGLKLVLLSMSFAAMAATIAPTDLADASWGGMKLLHLVLGTMGAGASLFFLPQFTGRMLGATVVCGVCSSVLGTPFIGWAISECCAKNGVPAPAANALAFSLGVGGVYIIPGIQAVASAFKANPLGVIDWIRGRGPAPSGSSPPPPSPPPQPAADEAKGGTQ